MAKGKGNTVEAVRELALPIAQANGVEIWDIRFEKEGPDWYLRIFLDKDGGVFISDCEAFSREIDPMLDEADFIEQSYMLEVSSAGLGRRLTRPEHFTAKLSEKVIVRLIHAENKEKEITGILQEFENGVVTLLKEDGNLQKIEINKTSFVKLCDDEDLF
jgi:Uncharacterized protein conserved in bacteria